MKSRVTREPGNTVEIEIEIPWQMIKKSFDTLYEKAAQEVEVQGFRKGKAPKELVEKQIDRTKVYEQVVNEVIPPAYTEAVKAHDLKPIISPKIELVTAAENKDWLIKIRTCERPNVQLHDYHTALTKARSQKKGHIWVPGKSEDKTKAEEPTIAELLDALYSEIEVEISPLLVEREVNRQLAQLLDQTQKLGLTVEQYLEAQGKTQIQLKQEYETQIKKHLALEFALEDIADKESVTVEPAEVDEFIKTAKTDAERKLLEQQRYYVASLLRRQKTLQKLIKPTVVRA